MFTLLNPAALLALLGLLVPVAIHLWNRRPGREVAVGSLRWLAAGANRRLRNLKPEQLWLLLLRAALLTVLAGALAGPAWRRQLPAGRGQVLLSPELAGTPALAALQPTLDSLRRRGYGLRSLAADFPPLPRSAWRADSGGRPSRERPLVAGRGAANSAGYAWARVSQATGAFPGQPLVVFAPAVLRGFQGVHAPLPARVRWYAVPTGATSAWVQAASLRGDSLGLLLGRSAAARTIFRRVAVARPRPGGALRVAGLPAMRFETTGDSGRLQPLNNPDASGASPLPPVSVRTRPLRVTIYATTEFAPDARSLRAALQALAPGLPMPLALSMATELPTPDPANRPDWLFWLADAPLPAAWRTAVRSGTQVWQEAAGPGVADTAQLATNAADEMPVAVVRRGTRPEKNPTPVASPTPSIALWADGLGRPVLSRQQVERGALYQLHTHLSPPWSYLADSPALPARLLALLAPDPIADGADVTTNSPEAALDQRTFDPVHLAIHPNPMTPKPTPTPTPGGSVPAEEIPAVPAFRFTDLRPWFVLATGLVFAFERLLAQRRDRTAAAATL